MKMPTLTQVVCVSCGVKDEAHWGDYGAEQSCLNCDAPAVDLVREEN